MSVSTSKLAAPLFASAALDPSVVGTHRVGRELLTVLEVDVMEGGGLAGRRVSELMAQEGMQVVAWRRAGAGWQTQPHPAAQLMPNDRVQVMVPGPRVAEVHALNRMTVQVG